MASVTLFTKPDCVQCKTTSRSLKEKHIDFDVIEMTAEQATEFRVQRNIMQAPVVIVNDDDGSELDIWSGFNPNKISEWKKALSKDSKDQHMEPVAV